MSAFYNEIDPYAAQWLRNLIDAGRIAPGVVDERSIVAIDPAELQRHTQCHFFAGIGVWSYALRLAGWPDDRPVWTGSCPCQPFSAAGKREGHEDERHLWPAWRRLIRECAPAVVFGEQVAGGDGLAWLDVVLADLEDDSYAVAAVDFPAAGVGAPHIRQRLFFVADAYRQRQQQHTQRDGAAFGGVAEQASRRDDTDGRRIAGELAQSAVPGLQGRDGPGQRVVAQRETAERSGAAGVMDDTHCSNGRQGPGLIGRERFTQSGEAGRLGNTELQSGRSEHESEPRQRRATGTSDTSESQGPGATSGFWSACDWLPCRDGKARPVEPKYVALVDGSTADLGLVRSTANEESEDIDAPQINGDGRARVRAMREDRMQAARSPSGREPGERQPIELTDFVRLLPSSLALAQLHGDTATANRLRALLETCGASRLVQHTPVEIEAAWRSLGEEGQDRFRLAVGAGHWLRTVEFPLVHGAVSRVGRLRAYGNAIVAEAAAAVISAYLEAA